MTYALLFAAAIACVNVRAPELCADLLNLQARDSAVRLERLGNWRDPIAAARMRAVDEENLACLEMLLRDHGWPRASDVGEQASVAAWTLIEHGSLDLQRRYIDEMTIAADNGELSWSLLATTIDRMLVREGKPQRYGTQFALRGGAWVPEPIDDPAHVDERRAHAGLRPLAEYAATINATYMKR